MVRSIARLLSLLLILASLVPNTTALVSAQSAFCADFDSWIWAQAVFDRDKVANAALDPDGNGIACEQLTVSGFAPAIWADAIPPETTPAKLVGVGDGDTIQVQYPDGTTDTVRLLHIDAPETSGTIGQCGGPESAAFLTWILSYAKDGNVFLENDATHRDRYDRRLAYVWFQVDGDPNPYMANDAMVLAGWADSETFKPDVKYKEQLDASKQFSINHVTGVRLKCGKFAQPANDAGPSNEQIRQAWLNQPNQGQLPPFPGTQVASQPLQPTQPEPVPQETGVDQTSDTSQPSIPEQPSAPPPTDTSTEVATDPPATEIPSPTDPPAEAPTQEVPPTEAPVYIPPTEAPVYVPPTEAPAVECDPSYPDFCLQPAWVIGDLDCGDIGYTHFTVYPPDSHNFDGNFDGVGCEGG